MTATLNGAPVMIHDGKVLVEPQEWAAALQAASQRIAELEAQVIQQQRAGYAATARANRVAGIENYLINVAKGNKPLPTAEDCKVMALRLGTPYAEWSDYVKEYKYGS